MFCLRMGRRRRRSSFSSLTLATVPRGLDVRTETTGVSFGTLSVCLPLKHSPTFLSTRAFLIPFPLHRSGLRSFEFSSPDKYEVLQLSSICDSSVPWFAPFLDRTMPSQSEDEQNLPSLELYYPSRIISDGNSLTDNEARSHLTQKSWTSLFCKLIANKVENPCTAS